MTRKTSESYLAVFEFVEERIFELEPAEFMTDYEDGLRLAIKTKWKDAVIRGCWFHYSRAIFKKSKKIGMARTFKREKNARAIRSKLMCLPLLPPNQIEEGYNAIQSFARQKGLLRRCEKLFSYFSDYWLKQVIIVNV